MLCVNHVIRNKSHNNNNKPMCFVLFLYRMGPAIFDYNKRLILLSVIQLSGGQ